MLTERKKNALGWNITYLRIDGNYVLLILRFFVGFLKLRLPIILLMDSENVLLFDQHKIMKSFRVLVYLRKFVTKDFARFQFVRRWSTITNFVMIKKK